MTYDPQQLDPEILQWTEKRIKEEYSVNEPFAKELAENALHSIESHGGNNENKEEIEKVVNVVVKTWINQRKEHQQGS